MNDCLPTDLIISAHVRTAAREGVPITVIHKGDSTSGVIILKINLMNGTARVLTRVYCDDELVWSPATGHDPMSEADADHYLERQTAIDPDSWLVEIEDRQGRHWFQGRVVN